MKKTKVGIVGMGMIGKAHWDALRRIPQVDIVAITDSDAVQTEFIAKQYDIPLWFTSCEAMFSHVDVIHNCTPNRIHDAVNRSAIASGKHIYAEKPLSLSAKDAYTTWKLAEKAGILHGLNHQYRMHAAVQEMRVRVQRGDIGRVFLVNGHYHQQSGLYNNDMIKQMHESNGVWALADVGTHWVDTACCVLGKRIAKVCANIQTIHKERIKPNGEKVDVDSDDLSSLLLSFEGGIQGVFSVSKVSAGHMNDLTLGIDGQQYSMYWEQENPNQLHIGHKKAPNQLLTMSPQLASAEVSDLVTRPGGHPLGWNDGLFLALRDFYATLRGEIAISTMRCATFENGFEGMAFVEAAVQSGKLGQWIAIQRSYESKALGYV